jgi:hypothetical protein
MTGTRWQLTGHVQVELPPGEAFRLFTPRGERDWVNGWEPHFPAPAADDTEPGTVFETNAHGRRTIWLVLDRQWGKRISYARVTPGDHAGTVTIVVNPSGSPESAESPKSAGSAGSAGSPGSAADGRSDVEVTYDLTALTGAAGPAVHRLREFSSSYPAYLRSWEDAIAASLRRR